MNDWFPTLAKIGFERMAILMSSDHCNQMSVDRIMQAATLEMPFAVAHFDDEEVARAWLLASVHPEPFRSSLYCADRNRSVKDAPARDIGSWVIEPPMARMNSRAMESPRPFPWDTVAPFAKRWIIRCC